MWSTPTKLADNLRHTQAPPATEDEGTWGVTSESSDDQWHYDVRVTYCNEAAAAAGGVSKEQFMGNWGVRDMKREQAWVDELARKIVTSIGSRKPIQVEQLYQYSNTDKYTTTLGLRRIITDCVYLGRSGPDGSWRRFVYSQRDVTKEMEMLDALKESQSRLNVIIQATHDGIWEWTPTQGYKWVTPYFASILGYTPEELQHLSRTPESWRDTIHPEDRDEMYYTYMSAITGKEKADTYDGERRVGTYLDIHERKLAAIALEEKNRQLDQAVQQAAAASQSKSEFLANISHEIRTPLNGVIGLSALLWETPLNADQQDLLKSIRECSEGLLLIVNDVLDFSKIDAGKLDLEDRPFDLLACIEGACYLLNLKASPKGISLSHFVEEGTPRFIRGDANRLRQVLINLLSNAVKFTEVGGVTIRVRSSPAETDGQVMLLIEVEDTGIGIPHDRMDRLFKSFSQVDSSTSRRFGGTGLGLAISKMLVEMMDTEQGRMWVTSEEGKGSTFYFCFRAAVCDELEVKVAMGVSTPSADSDSGSAVGSVGVSGKDGKKLGELLPLTILVAEDNLVNQKLTVRLLQKLGYEADVVNNGVEAVAAIQDGSKEYNMVLMDVQMPIMSGLEATTIIRGDPNITQPVILGKNWRTAVFGLPVALNRTVTGCFPSTHG
ncbi:hypothetical protein HK104_000264 [Borealophlyctis nickersoniae]|nr:hypothetical protein HK104_000264 [Borealophlyctis nickersoniae]